MQSILFVRLESVAIEPKSTQKIPPMLLGTRGPKPRSRPWRSKSRKIHKYTPENRLRILRPEPRIRVFGSLKNRSAQLQRQ